MKVKRLPEDFVVEELSDVRTAEGGLFALYRLRKQGLSTLEAIEAIQRRWQLPRNKLSWGGLKDKHAITTQHVTIHRGPRRNLQQDQLSLEFLGWTGRAFTALDIRANRFRIVLRDLDDEQVANARDALPEIRQTGLPNYFDDQRFGSVSPDGEFIAEPWIRGDYERALWLTFAEPNPFDRGSELQEKETLRTLWGRWPECKQALGKSHRRSIVTFLADRPGDFKGAWARVRQDLRSLYLAAFQSQLWNELLAAWLRAHCSRAELVDVPLKTGPVPFPLMLSEETIAALEAATLPLPSARIRLEDIEDPDVRDLVVQTLAARGLELRSLRVKYPRDSFFSKGWRSAAVALKELQASAAADELHPGRQKLALEFDLPRGSYATILIKRITDAVGTPIAARRLQRRP